MPTNRKHKRETIPKDHIGLYLCPPLKHGTQIELPSEKDILNKHLWNLWSLSGGKIGIKPPKNVMEEWK